MNTTTGLDQHAAAWLADGPTELSDRVLDAALREVHLTKQRRVMRVPWRFPLMPAMSRATAVAAVALVAVVGAGGLLYLNSTNQGDPGGSLSPARSPAATSPDATSPAVSSPAATPRPDPDGLMAPGRYAAHPLPAPADTLTVEFTVPEDWEALANASSLIPRGDGTTAGPGGMAIQFTEVTTINGDICQWSGADDDVPVGPAVDDLVEALRSQTDYEVSDALDVTIGGFTGKRVDILLPGEGFTGQTAVAPECDDDVMRLWDTTQSGPAGIYVQGPDSRWQANILDVDGTRLVVVLQDYPGTPPADRAEMDAIVSSLVIKP